MRLPVKNFLLFAIGCRRIFDYLRLDIPIRYLLILFCHDINEPFIELAFQGTVVALVSRLSRGPKISEPLLKFFPGQPPSPKAQFVLLHFLKLYSDKTL